MDRPERATQHVQPLPKTWHGENAQPLPKNRGDENAQPLTKNRGDQDVQPLTKTCAAKMCKVATHYVQGVNVLKPKECKEGPKCARAQGRFVQAR